MIFNGSLAGNGQPASNGRGRMAAMVSWCLYDWANSAFPAVVSTFVFSVYFTKSVAQSPIAGSLYWSWTVTVAGLFIALLSPIAGAIADQTGRRKMWLVGFTLINVIACACLWFVEPTPDHVVRATLIYAIAATAFGLAMVFYDSMLAELATPASLGRLSGIGWAFGYFGGLFCLLIVLFGLVNADTAIIQLDHDQGEHVRTAVVFVAAWYLVFSLPLFLMTGARTGRQKALSEAVSTGLTNLLTTITGLRERPVLTRFLLAQMFIADGLTTLILFGGVYAAGTFGFEISEILTFAIFLYVTAGFGAATFGWLDDKIGPKRVIMIALTAILALVVGLALATTKTHFWFLGASLGLFIGPAQAASRSLMTRLTPVQSAAELFGLYTLAGKITVFVGPLLFGLLTDISGTQRAGLLIVIVFLVAGIVTLRPLVEPAAGSASSTSA